MPQLEVDKLQDEFVVGGDISPSNLSKTRTNKDPQAARIDTISVSGASDETTYKVKFEGGGLTIVLSVTTDDSATADELVTLLNDVINDEVRISGRVVAESDLTADTVTVTSRFPGEDFTLTVVQDTPGHLSISNTQPNAGALPIPFGRGVERHGALDDSGGHVFARLPNASNLSQRVLLITLEGSTDGLYRVTVEYDEGKVFTAEFDAAANSEDEILEGIRDDLNNNGPDLLEAAVDTSPNPSELYFRAATNGFGDFQITAADGPSVVNFETRAAGDDIRDKFDGIAIVGHPSLVEPKDQVGQYDANEHMNVLRDGLTAVATEKDPAEGDRVYIRLAASGDNDELGGFRPDFDSGCVPLPKSLVEWERVTKPGLATVRVHA